MDLRQLEYFAQIAECGGFNRAASHLNIAQSALSRHMSQLEYELGVSLFERTSRGAQLTEAGQLLRRRAAVLMQQIRSLRDEVRAQARLPFGDVSVGIPTALRRILAAPLLSRLGEAYPSIQVTLVTGMSRDIRDSVISGKLDLGAYGLLEPEAQLEATPIFREDLLVVGAPGSALAGRSVMPTDELAALPLVVLSRDVLRALWRKLGAQVQPDAAKVLVVGDGPLQIELARGGRYYSILPRTLVQEHLDRGELISAKLNGAFYYWSVSRSADRALSLPVRLAFNSLLECARTAAPSCAAAQAPPLQVPA